MERDDVIALLDVQRKVFNDFIDRLQRDMKVSQGETNKSLADVVKSLEFVQAETEDLKKKLEVFSKEKVSYEKQINILANENIVLRKKTDELEGRCDFMDDQRRHINLRISGVQERNGENWEQCQIKVKQILKDHLNINPSIERINRVGKPTPGNSRDIIARFTNISERDSVFRDRRKLKGTNIYINEDLCPGTAAARKQQMDAYHMARRQGKVAYFNHKTLIVREPNSDGFQREGQSASSGGIEPQNQGLAQNQYQTPRARGTRGTSPAPTPPIVGDRRTSESDQRLSVTPLDRTGGTTPRTPNRGVGERGRRETRQKRGTGTRR